MLRCFWRWLTRHKSDSLTYAWGETDTLWVSVWGDKDGTHYEGETPGTFTVSDDPWYAVVYEPPSGTQEGEQ